MGQKISMLAIAILFLLSFLLSFHSPLNAKELSKMNADLALWTKFSFARRNEMIEIAKKIAIDRYSKFDFEAFKTISIEKNSVEYRVSFLPSEAKSSTATALTVFLSPIGVSVDPKDRKAQTGWKKINENERPRKKGEGHYLEVFNVAKPKEMILLAKGLAQGAYGDTDLSDFSGISVYKNTGQFKVEFRAPYTNGGQKNEDPSQPPGGAKTNMFTVHISEGGASVDPYKPEYLEKFPSVYRKIAALFAPGDSLSIQEQPEHYKVSASRSGGGAEGFTIDKKTFEKKMTWHEHPRREDNIPLVDRMTGSPVPEQWIKLEE